MAMVGGSQGKSRATLSEINITPLVDVMLVLLIMFMVTTPLMQQGIEVTLPKTAANGVSVTEEPLFLSIEAKGRLSIASNEIPMKNLSSKLKAIMKNRKNKQIFIQADQAVDYGYVARAMGEIRKAGIYQIGLVTLPEERGGD